MAQSISHPDCVHCHFMKRQPGGEYHCRQHDIILHTPVSLFCKMIRAVDGRDEEYEQWFAEAPALDWLDSTTLYTWVEIAIPDEPQSSRIVIEVHTVAPVRVYKDWSAGYFWQHLRELRRRRLQLYKTQNFAQTSEP